MSHRFPVPTQHGRRAENHSNGWHRSHHPRNSTSKGSKMGRNARDVANPWVPSVTGLAPAPLLWTQISLLRYRSPRWASQHRFLDLGRELLGWVLLEHVKEVVSHFENLGRDPHAHRVALATVEIDDHSPRHRHSTFAARFRARNAIPELQTTKPRPNAGHGAGTVTPWRRSSTRVRRTARSNRLTQAQASRSVR